MKKLSLFFLFWVFAFFMLASCGLVHDKPEDFDFVHIEKVLSPPCKIDTDKMMNFFEENVEAEVLCAAKNLSLFTRYAKRQGEEFTLKSDLKKIADKYYFSDKEKLNNLVEIFYNLNTLLTGESSDILHDENISAVVDVILKVNRSSIEINRLFKERGFSPEKNLGSNDKISFLMNDLISFIQNKTSQKRSLTETKINLNLLLDGIENSLYSRKFPKYFKEIILVGKRVFLGGHERMISQSEFVSLLEMAPELFSFFLNSSNLQEASIEKIDEMKWLFLKRRENDVIYDRELFPFLEMIIEEKKELGNAKDFLLFMHKFVLENQNDFISEEEVLKLFTLSKLALKSFSLAQSYERIKLTLTKDNYEESLNEFLLSLEKFSKEALFILQEGQALPSRIDLKEISKALKNSIPLFKDLDLEWIQSLLDTKKLLWGGAEIVTPEEMKTILADLPHFGEIFFKATFAQKNCDKSEDLFKKLPNRLSKIEKFRSFFGFSKGIFKDSFFFKKDHGRSKHKLLYSLISFISFGKVCK